MHKLTLRQNHRIQIVVRPLIVRHLTVLQRLVFNSLENTVRASDESRSNVWQVPPEYRPKNVFEIGHTSRKFGRSPTGHYLRKDPFSMWSYKRDRPIFLRSVNAGRWLKIGQGRVKCDLGMTKGIIIVQL